MIAQKLILVFVSAGAKRLQRTTTACYVLKGQPHPVRGGLPRS